VIDSDAGGIGSFANEPSPDTVMYLPHGNAILSMVSGFTDGFSFYYAALAEASVSVHAGIDATGTLLAGSLLGKSDRDCTGDPTGLYCNWTLVAMNFPGIARSVAFRGEWNGTGFDDITLGSAASGSGNGSVPEPASIALFGLGLAGVAATCRARRPVHTSLT